MIEMTPLIQVILTFLIGALTVGGSVYAVKASRPKIEADTAAVLTQSAGEWVKRLDGRIDDLEAELHEMRDINRRLRRWAKVLVAEVHESGGVPTPFESVT